MQWSIGCPAGVYPRLDRGRGVRLLMWGADSPRNPRDGRGKILRGERAEILDTLADADEVHGYAVLRRDCHQDAAARGAVELGHHQAGDARRLGEHLDL